MILLREEGESSRETNLSGQPLEARRKETERERNQKREKSVYEERDNRSATGRC